MADGSVPYTQEVPLVPKEEGQENLAQPGRSDRETRKQQSHLSIEECHEDDRELAEQGFPLSSEIGQAIRRLEEQSIMKGKQDTKKPNQDVDLFRRQFLEASIHTVEITPLLPLINLPDNDILARFSQALIKPLHLDEMTFQYLEICTKQFWYNRQSAVLSSRDLYRPVYAHLQKMIALLEESLLSTERMRLCSLLSQTAQLLGEISLDIIHRYLVRSKLDRERFCQPNDTRTKSIREEKALNGLLY
jgi:hypothetical protein